MNGLFFELLQIAIGNRKELTRQLTDDEWASMYGICEKQALLGIAFAGVEKLPKEQYPPFDVLAEWVHDAQVTKDRNELLNKRCHEVCKILDRDGFYSCILKGQSNLANYPEKLRESRTVGDIDVLCWPKEPMKGYMDVIRYAHSISPEVMKGEKIEVLYHHVDWEYQGGIVEIHFRPSYFNSPWYNWRFQKWWRGTVYPIEDDLGIITAPVSFNVVYQLVHIYRHLFNEGIGLRQLLDYYFVLRKVRDDRFEIMRVVECFGMKRFAAAVMYVLQTVFAMPDEYLLWSPDERRGRFLLNEIMLAGNFGFYDERNVIDAHESYLKRFIRRQKRFSRFLIQYPSEVIWGPYFTVKQRLWRVMHGWK